MVASDAPREVGRHRLTIPSCGEVDAIVFEPDGERSWVVAIVLGDLTQVEVPLVRLHSRCLYGEVFESLDCDCRAQIDLALEEIAREGVGVFVYLEQEGRAAGLLNKARAYVLKETSGLDTVEAYRELGLPLDQRSYAAAASILRSLGLKRVRLLTNNPAKLAGLTAENIEAERVPLRTEPTRHNVDYLRVKQSKLGQSLGLPREGSSSALTPSDVDV